MSILTTAIVQCDDCGEPQDDGDHGHRSRSAARRLARRYGAKRRRMADGKWYDICDNCDGRRHDEMWVGGYDRREPRRGQCSRCSKADRHVVWVR